MPIYEYVCGDDHKSEVLHKSIPKDMDSIRVMPCNDASCTLSMELRPSLGMYGEAEQKSWMRLSREKRRYHGNAPSREAADRDRPGSSMRGKKRPISRDDVDEYRERVHRPANVPRA